MKKFSLNNFLSPLLAVVMILAVGLFTSCEDDDKNIFNDFSNDGGFVRFVFNNPPTAIGVNQISDLSYSFEIEDANKNVASYELSLYADLSGSRSDTVTVEVVTSFPRSFSFSASDLATLLGITVDDIAFGDSFFFSGEATTTSGAVYSGSTRLNSQEVFIGDNPGEYVDEDGDPVELGPTDRVTFAPSDDPEEDDKIFIISGQGITDDLLAEDGYRQAFEFDFIILCPSVDYATLPGIWNVDFHRFDAFFGPQGNTRTIVAGPGENQITIIGGAVPLDGADDLIIEIDPATSEISFAGDSANDIHFNTFGPGIYGSDVTGLAFTCIGKLDITITSPGFIPNFLTLSKPQ